MQVWINGQARELPDGSAVIDALTALDAPQTGIAVAVDGIVVPRVQWSRTALVDGARLEVLTAVQGG